MKKFKTKKNIKKVKKYYIFTILFITFTLLTIYNHKLKEKIINISESKLEEVTNLYIKNNIVPKDVELNKLIIIEKNKKEEITSLDIDMNYANSIMVDVIKKIQNNIFLMEFEENDILKKHNNNLYVDIPLYIKDEGSLITNIGPKVPIKLSFYEHAFGNIDVRLENYGINNALIKVYLSVTIEQKLYIPYKEKKNYKEIDILIGSKIINGVVPSIYGPYLSKTSELLNS